MKRNKFAWVLLTCGVLAGPASAAERGFSVTSFTRLRVEGPVQLIIRTGRSPSAQAEGDRRTLDRLKLDNIGDMLVVGIDRSNWVGESGTTGRSEGPAIVRISTDRLETLTILGDGDASLDRATGGRFTLTLAGNGRAAVTGLDVDTLVVTINGGGEATLAGKARDGRVRIQGNGAIDGKALTINDADTLVIGAGTLRVGAARTAHNVLRGAGTIEILGRPACSGDQQGAGEVRCGE